MDWVNAVLQGILLGGLYALFAAGLSLIFGVMRLVNIAHGDLIVLSAFIGLTVTEVLGLSPFISLFFVIGFMAILGYFLQRTLLNRTIGSDILPPLLVTFGLSIIIQNVLLEIYTADSQKLNAGSIETQSIQIFGEINLGVLPCIMFFTSVFGVYKFELFKPL